jgi:sugar lactone lactonase YvrE
MDVSPRVIVEGLVFPECPRWHDGALWFSDMNGGKIITAGADGRARTVIEHAQRPAGLDWLPDGTLLFVSMLDRKLLCAVDGGKGTVADLGEHEPVSLNDMCVDAQGRAYIGAFGFDLNGGAAPSPADLYLVQPDGEVRVAASELMFPNGIVISEDGGTLVVAETVGRRLTAFAVGADGSLSGRRTWAEVEGAPDGICLDAEGAIWVASPPTSTFLRVREGGAVTERFEVPGKWAVACMLGGDDGRTLFLCTAETTLRDLAQSRSRGWIETVRVDVPRAGRP